MLQASHCPARANAGICAFTLLTGRYSACSSWLVYAGGMCLGIVKHAQQVALLQVSITMIATGFGSGVVEAALRPAAQRQARELQQQQQQQQQPQQQPPRQVPVERYGRNHCFHGILHAWLYGPQHQSLLLRLCITWRCFAVCHAIICQYVSH